MDVRIKRMLAISATIVIATQLAIKCSQSEATLDDRLQAAEGLSARQRYDQALEVYRRATGEFALDPRAWVAYGDALLTLRFDVPEADEAYRRGASARASAVGPTAAANAAVARRRRGLLAWARGDADLAETELRGAADAADGPALRDLALMRSCLRLPGADAALAEALRLQPNDPRLLLADAAAKAAAGKTERARTLRDEGLAAASASDTPERAGDRWVRYLCARADALLGDRERAARCLAATLDGAKPTLLDDAPPLTRAEVAADPAFAAPDPALAAAIARWPQRAPFNGH